MNEPATNAALRRGENIDTPWGWTETAPYRIAPGLWLVETPSHGGLYLEERIQDQLSPVVLETLLNGSCWAEEDCEADIIVAILFQEMRADLEENNSEFARQDTDGRPRVIDAARYSCREFPAYEPCLPYLP